MCFETKQNKTEKKTKKKKVKQGLLCLVQGRISGVIEAIQSSKVYKPSKIRQCNSLHTLWCQLVKRSKWLSVRANFTQGSCLRKEEKTTNLHS